MWKDCLVASRGPGRCSSCQQLVKTLHPHCRRKKMIILAKILHFCAGPWVISFLISKKTFNRWSLEIEWLSWTIPLIPWVNTRLQIEWSINTNSAGPTMPQSCKSWVISQFDPSFNMWRMEMSAVWINNDVLRFVLEVRIQLGGSKTFAFLSDFPNTVNTLLSNILEDWCSS